MDVSVFVGGLYVEFCWVVFGGKTAMSGSLTYDSQCISLLFEPFRSALCLT
jgi:hypothetical protein